MGWQENTVGKGENAGYQCFQKASLSGSIKAGLYGKESMRLQKVSTHVSLGRLMQDETFCYR